MMVAQNGSNWYMLGSPDPRWNNKHLDDLKRVAGSNFEVVKMRKIYKP
jgi:hypothetical protein